MLNDHDDVDKSKPWQDGFAKQIVNSYIYECDKRRADNLFGDNKHDFWAHRIDSQVQLLRCLLLNPTSALVLGQ